MSPKNSEKFSSNEVAESKTVSQQTDANSSEKDTINFKINKKTAKVGALALAGVVGVSSLFAGLSACRDKSKVKAFESTTAPTEITETIESSISETTPIATIETTSPAVETSASVETTVEDSEVSNIDYTQPPKDIVECYGFENLTPEQQQTLTAYDAMSVEDFQKLPESDQLTFANWVYENFSGRINQVKKVNNIEDLYYTENPTKPEDFVRNEKYLQFFVSALRTKDENGKWHLDNVTAEKMCSMMYSTSDKHTDGWNAYANSLTLQTPLVTYNSSVTDYRIDDNSAIISFTVQDSEAATFSEHNTQHTYSKVSFKTIDGETKTIWRVAYAISDTNSEYIKNLQ